MNLTTTYMGLELRSPLVIGAAAPLTEDIDNIKRMEDAGAAAVVLHSLFEEQIEQEMLTIHHHLQQGTESYAESLTYFPEPEIFHVGPALYLEHIRKAKERVNIPMIASLNGSTLGGWTNYARQIEQAGADALELNIYYIPTEIHLTGEAIEQQYLDILKAVKAVVTIPVAVKLNVLLSTPQAMRLPMRWIAILYGRIAADLAATSGIQKGVDVVRMLMAGAKVTMIVSALLRHGINHLQDIEQELRQWMQEHDYSSVREMQGIMSQCYCPNPSEFERVQYMKAIQTYTPKPPVLAETAYVVYQQED